MEINFLGMVSRSTLSEVRTNLITLPAPPPAAGLGAVELLYWLSYGSTAPCCCRSSLEEGGGADCAAPVARLTLLEDRLTGSPAAIRRLFSISTTFRLSSSLAELDLYLPIW